MATVLNEDTQPTSSISRGQVCRQQRGRGPGRGSGRGRGRGGAQNNARTVALEWRIEVSDDRGIILQDEFFSGIVAEKTRLFCLSAIDRLDVECSVRQLPHSRAGHVLLFMNDTLTQCMEWLNEKIVLHELGRRKLTLPDMYNYLSIMLLFHCSGFSFGKSFDILNSLGSSTPSLELVRFVSSNILAYSATRRGTDGLNTWNSQRDQTPLLSTFEKTAFTVTRKVFLNPNQLLATLDDDLYGTRANGNLVKTSSSCKADEEGHTADAIADAFFRITLGVRFFRRGASQMENVDELLNVLLEGRGEHSLQGFLITADRGYCRISLLKKLLKHGIGAVLVMPEHLFQCHLFVGGSFFDVPRNDDEEGSDGNEGEMDEVDNSDLDDNLAASESNQQTSASAASLVYDRPKKFIIKDTGNSGPAVFSAKKSLSVSRVRGATQSMVTVIVAGNWKSKMLVEYYWDTWHGHLAVSM